MRICRTKIWKRRAVQKGGSSIYFFNHFSPWGTINLLDTLYFSLLKSTDIVLFFFFFTNWRSMIAQHWVILSTQFSKQHLHTLNLLSHFGNSHNISSFSSVIIFIMVICNQWSLMLLPQLTEDSDDGEDFLAIKCF